MRKVFILIALSLMSIMTIDASAQRSGNLKDDAAANFGVGDQRTLYTFESIDAGEETPMS